MATSNVKFYKPQKKKQEQLGYTFTPATATTTEALFEERITSENARRALSKEADILTAKFAEDTQKKRETERDERYRAELSAKHEKDVARVRESFRNTTTPAEAENFFNPKEEINCEDGKRCTIMGGLKTRRRTTRRRTTRRRTTRRKRSRKSRKH